MRARNVILVAALGLLALVPLSAADPKPAVPILVDTDVGTSLDDAFALALVLASPELELRGVTTVSGDTMTRAWMVCRLLTMAERKGVAVAAGAAPQPANPVEGQYQYRYHPAVIYNRTVKPAKESAVDLMYRQLKADPGKVTLVALGPLTNIARLLTDHPDCKPWIKRIVLMGGSIRSGPDGKAGAVAEWNIKTDVKAAQTVFSAGVPLTVAPLDATATVKLTDPAQLFQAGTMLTYQLQALHQMADDPQPILFDPVAVTLAHDERFFTMADLHLEVDDQGFTKVGKGKPNARVATGVKAQEYLDWYRQRVTTAHPAAPAKAPANVSKPVAQGGFPSRVHTFEDFETDIEKRWWLSGRAAAPTAANRTRHLRGILTLDFDDRMGDLKTMYNAVVFNPVPGPPMGPMTRLSFRYWVKGTDQLRIQLYSLSNGYHRYLALHGVEQGKWVPLTVDMTAMRKPDGSGGPLAENERIDDIQFYVDPKAELLIDDIVLYDAAADDERRPFPRKLLYTGWFDSGKQGKEWPGTFDVVDKNPLPWKAAKSVPNAQTESPWIRLHLRGERPAGEKTHLNFQYRLTGVDSLRVVLLNSTAKTTHEIELKGLKQGEWTAGFADFSLAKSGGPKSGDKVDELHFLLPRGAELLLDDVLLYAPGK